LEDFTLDTGNTAWVLISSALVMLMLPGLALFYGGLVRSKNVVGTLMQCFIIFGIVSIIWVVCGYSLAFGPDQGGFIGNLEWGFLRGLTADSTNPDFANPLYAGPAGVPHLVFVGFQMMFAMITPALIVGAFAERAKFSTLCVFTALWTLLVYGPIAHWVWAENGFIGLNGDIKALDFAGGTVVHINAGVAALCGAILFGKRHGYGKEAMEPHDVTMCMLGAGMLWFGWFGFNAGSELAADGIAANALVVTNTAAATAGVTWTLLSWMRDGKPSGVGFATGAVAGLVAITPAAGFVDTPSALVIGLAAGSVCYFAVKVRIRSGLDDSLDVVGVHGVGGIIGAVLTGVFATTEVNPLGSGLIDGEADQIWRQLAAIGVTLAWSGVLSFGLFYLLDKTMGLRVSEEEELLGLDASQHGERAYAFDEAGVPILISEMVEEGRTAEPSGRAVPSTGSL
jgi:Amt family ammonium transporter